MDTAELRQRLDAEITEIKALAAAGCLLTLQDGDCNPIPLRLTDLTAQVSDRGYVKLTLMTAELVTRAFWPRQEDSLNYLSKLREYMAAQLPI